MTLKCPRCGRTDIQPDKTSAPNGPLYSFYCNSCDLYEDAARDHEAIYRLRRRWGDVDGGETEKTHP